MHCGQFSWRNYTLRLKVLQPALCLWDREKPTWYVVTKRAPFQIWRVAHSQTAAGGQATTFMRSVPTLEEGQELAQQHWQAEVERGLHADSFPLAPEPTIDLRPKPFWTAKEGHSETGALDEDD